MVEINTAIILAAGRGSRMKAGVNKQFLLLKGKPLIVHTLQAFESCSEVDEIIVVTAPEELQYFKHEILDVYKFEKVVKLIPGGAERQQSAYNGIVSVSKDSEIIILHDGARPFVNQQVIIACINAAKIHGASSAGMPSKDTIKLVNEQNIVEATPVRDSVWITQTPQAFKSALIKSAHESALSKAISATDDAMLVELMGSKVKMVQATYENIKITTPQDIVIAELLIDKALVE